MKFLGIEFVPLNTPLKTHLQTLSAFYVYAIVPVSIGIGLALTTYVLFCTRYWMIAVVYLIWIWIIDKNTPEQGGRKNITVSNFTINTYAKNYFPANLKLVDGLTLDAKRNYLFGIFPHGILPVGAYITLVSNAARINEVFPHHTVSALTISQNFIFPIARDIALLMGGCSNSEKSINYLLSSPKGGKIAALQIGGVEEMLYARPGCYRIILKHRKGFVKLALKNGSPIVPVFSFGENDVFAQVSNPKGSLLRTFQDWFKRKTGLPLIFISGRGFFQYTFGIIPRRTPINVVVGVPIEVRKNENPTQSDIDALHTKFIEELKELFDAHKHHYIKNSENAELVIC